MKGKTGVNIIMKKAISSKMGFFSMAVLLIWLKSYFVYLFEFNLGMQNNIQHFLLFFNPLSSALIFLGIALFSRRFGMWIIIIQSFMSFLLYANVVFYRFNNDFITLPVLTQTSNFGSLGDSIISLIAWHDLLYALDIVILIVLYTKVKHHWSTDKIKIRKQIGRAHV